MKYILTCLILVSFSRCKETKKTTFTEKLDTQTTIKHKLTSNKNRVNKLDSTSLFGDELISNKNYITELDTTTILNLNGNPYPLERLKFNYKRTNFKNSYTNSSIRLEIGDTKPKYIKYDNGNEVIIYNERYLKTYKNEKKIDSILMYKEETTQYSSQINYSYVNKKLELWILEVLLPLEEESAINYWKKYKIDTSKGNIILTEELIKQRYGNNAPNEITLKVDSIVYAQVKTYLNVRATPNANGNIIAKAYPKDGLKVLEVLEGWVKVALNGKEGYVSSEFVK